ncbi:MAG: hypothetical protein RLZZ312_772 [Bacteroidota bacterium]
MKLLVITVYFFFALLLWVNETNCLLLKFIKNEKFNFKCRYDDGFCGEFFWQKWHTPIKN